jgi:U3 small nucleolar RNA-associated protein 22
MSDLPPNFIYLHFHKLTTQMIFSLAMLTGTQVAKGHASKFFQPFLLPKDLKGRPEELKNKLLVDFNPSRCFIKDLEASTMKMI